MRSLPSFVSSEDIHSSKVSSSLLSEVPSNSLNEEPKSLDQELPPSEITDSEEVSNEQHSSEQHEPGLYFKQKKSV